MKKIYSFFLIFSCLPLLLQAKDYISCWCEGDNITSDPHRYESGSENYINFRSVCKMNSGVVKCMDTNGKVFYPDGRLPSKSISIKKK